MTDRTTRRGDPYLAPFPPAVRAGVAVRHDVHRPTPPHRPTTNPAAFSSKVIPGTLLRGDLKFGGVVVSDDLANARQVARWSPGERAVSFIGAGGDMVLTVNPDVLPQMYDAVLARARSNPAFRRQVDAAVLRVLTAKEHGGMIGRRPSAAV